MMRLAEPENAELQIQRADCKVIHRFSIVYIYYVFPYTYILMIKFNLC